MDASVRLTGIPREDVVMAACISAEYDASYLKHYIEHYRHMCSEIRLVVNARTEEVMDAFPFISDLPDCRIIYEKWVGGFVGREQVQRVCEQLSQSDKKWAMHADVDELHDGPLMVSNEASFAYGVMIDRLAEDLRPADVHDAPSLSEQFPKSARLTRYLVQGCDHKPVVWINREYTVFGPHRLKGHSTRFIRDYMKKNRASIINHYKWTFTTHQKLLNAHADYLKLGVSYSDEKLRAQIFYHEDKFMDWLSRADASVFDMSGLIGGDALDVVSVSDVGFLKRLFRLAGQLLTGNAK